MAALTTALMIGLVVAAPEVDYVTSGRSEGRVRSTQIDGEPLTENEVGLSPRAALEARWGVLDGRLEYAPTLVLRNMLRASPPDTELLHNLALDARWRLDRRSRLEVLQDVGYGERRFTLLDAAGGATGAGGAGTGGTGGVGGGGGGAGSLGTGNAGSAVPPLEAIRIFRSITRLTAGIDVGRRSNVALYGGYVINGGADAEAQELLPQQQGPMVGAVVQHRPGARDLLETEALYQELSFTPDEHEVELVQVTTSWRRMLARRTQVSAGAGLGAGRLRTETEGVWRLLPSVRAVVDHQVLQGRDRSVTLNVGLTYMPFVDPFVARLEERLEARAGAQWAPHRQWVGGLGTSVGALPREPLENRRLTVAALGFLGFRPTDWSQAEANVAWSWERDALIEGGRRQWLVGLSFFATAAGPL